MSIYRGRIVNNQPIADWKAIYAQCRKHADKGFVIEVRPYSPDHEISLRQMAYYHAVILPLFSAYTGDSQHYWDHYLKLVCGSKWFKSETVRVCGREITTLPSKTTLSIKDFSEWYQNIRDFGDSINCIVPPPDPQWRIHRVKEGV